MQSVNPGQNQQMVDWKAMGADKKLVAGLCGILVGGFGVHKFVLGYTTEGVIQIVITVLTCGMGSIVGLVEGIIYLTKSDEEFVRTYIQGRKGWF
jgi:TM2 domain-containing membrane protein YozV